MTTYGQRWSILIYAWLHLLLHYQISLNIPAAIMCIHGRYRCRKDHKSCTIPCDRNGAGLVVCHPHFLYIGWMPIYIHTCGTGGTYVGQISYMQVTYLGETKLMVQVYNVREKLTAVTVKCMSCIHTYACDIHKNKHSHTLGDFMLYDGNILLLVNLQVPKLLSC